jgi:hypothetical protein
MKKIILFTILFMSVGVSIAQSINRDPDTRKDFANVFYKSQYTLFDMWSDEPIFPDSKGVYNIYYATNENRTPNSFIGNSSQLQGMTVYKFKNYSNCKNWCDGVILKRDPDTRKDFANVFYKPQYTLFDMWSDEPILPDSKGVYNIYYATNENRTPNSFIGNSSQLQGMTVYKFKDYSNCKNWCDGVLYNVRNSKTETNTNNSTTTATSTSTSTSTSSASNSVNGVNQDEMKKSYKCKCCNSIINGLYEGVDQDGSKVNTFTLEYYTNAFKDPQIIKLFNVSTLSGDEPVRNAYDIMRRDYYHFCSMKCSRICKE